MLRSGETGRARRMAPLPRAPVPAPRAAMRAAHVDLGEPLLDQRLPYVDTFSLQDTAGPAVVAEPRPLRARLARAPHLGQVEAATVDQRLQPPAPQPASIQYRRMRIPSGGVTMSS